MRSQDRPPALQHNVFPSGLQVTQHSRLLENNATLARLIAMRNPNIDPINIMQVRARGCGGLQQCLQCLAVSASCIASRPYLHHDAHQVQVAPSLRGHMHCPPALLHAPLRTRASQHVLSTEACIGVALLLV